jgi:hypothetical protein
MVKAFFQIKEKQKGEALTTVIVVNGPNWVFDGNILSRSKKRLVKEASTDQTQTLQSWMVSLYKDLNRGC